jgi:hypothetical protein
MHAVEVSGFLPFIDANLDRLPRVVAGLCLDSVGQDFAKCGGELVLFQSPEHAPSFIDGLLETLIRAAAAEPIHRFSKDNYATFPWHTEPYWGNDAFISEGYFDIPTPQLSTWPDRFYHSSQDTPDQMSDNTLGRVGAITGTYLFLLATAGAKEARWFGHLAAQDWKRRIAQTVADCTTAALAETMPSQKATETISLVRHLGLQGHDAVVQATRFAPGDEKLQAELMRTAQDVVAFAEAEAQNTRHILGAEPIAAHPIPSSPEGEVPGETLVARRLRWSAPPSESLSDSARTRLEALRTTGDGELDLDRIWKWINGRRTARDLYQRLRHGGEIPLAAVIEYLRVMEEGGALGLV